MTSTERPREDRSPDAAEAKAGTGGGGLQVPPAGFGRAPDDAAGAAGAAAGAEGAEGPRGAPAAEDGAAPAERAVPDAALGGGGARPDPEGGPVAEEDDDADDGATRPPSTALRKSTPAELFAEIPEIRSMMTHRPREGESLRAFMVRLRDGATPEEVVTFTAFAAQPAMAIWWAYSCLRELADIMSPEDRGLMELIAAWSGNPDHASRWRVMKAGLYAPAPSPVVQLALAVGWSGGAIAPNDPAPVPAWRTPRAVNTAVLSGIAQVSLEERQRRLARFIDLAGKMFEVY